VPVQGLALALVMAQSMARRKFRPHGKTP